MTSTPKIAVVHDWLVEFGGAEKVLEAILELYPDAPVYTLVFDADGPCSQPVRGHRVGTSFIQKLPRARRSYRSYLPLFPLAIEQFDLSDFDLVISSSYAVAKGALTHSRQLHISYLYTPMRYAWDLYHKYLRDNGLEKGLRGGLARLILHYIRLWDLASASRVDTFVAISQNVARRVQKTYHRPAQVIYPPVSVEAFTPRAQKEDFYLTVSRLVSYKKVDLMIDAFSRMPEKKLAVIGFGPDRQKLAERAGKNVEFLGFQPFEVLKDYMERARALIFAAEEDFGIVPVEAQASGTPVIAYSRGGALETILPGKTGLFFNEQTPESLIVAIQAFENLSEAMDIRTMRRNAERFSKERFLREFRQMVESEWEAFESRQGPLHNGWDENAGEGEG